MWAPDGESFVVGQRHGGSWRVYRISTYGQVLDRLVGRDFAFTSDGRLALMRGDEIVVERADGGFSRSATFSQLRRRAGFAAEYVGGMSGARGYGPAVAVQWSESGGTRRSVLLLVYPDGRVARATPIYTGQSYMPGPPSWAPTGVLLAIPWQRAPRPGERGGHTHCLALWTEGGYRSTACAYPHFDTIAWAPNGRSAVTDGGQIFGRDGRVIGRAANVGVAVGARWVRQT